MQDDSDPKNRRRHPRRTVVWKSQLHVGSHKLNCWVRNISPYGALLQIDLPLAQQSPVSITLEKIGSLSGFIAWSDGSMHGIAFIETPEAVLARFGGTEADALGFFKKHDNVTPIADAAE
jgi:PilZ domain